MDEPDLYIMINVNLFCHNSRGNLHFGFEGPDRRGEYFVLLADIVSPKFWLLLENLPW